MVESMSLHKGVPGPSSGGGERSHTQRHSHFWERSNIKHHTGYEASDIALACHVVRSLPAPGLSLPIPCRQFCPMVSRYVQQRARSQRATARPNAPKQRLPSKKT